jgi:hypothetical protein
MLGCVESINEVAAVNEVELLRPANILLLESTLENCFHSSLTLRTTKLECLLTNIYIKPFDGALTSLSSI